MSQSICDEATRAWVGFAVVETIRCFEKSGVFDALEQPATAGQLAERLALPLRPLELTLPILTSFGYLERVGEMFRRPLEYMDTLEALPQLESFLHRGHVGDSIDRPENRGAYYARCVLALARLFEGHARRLAEQLPPAETILDVGAGSAVWSLAMAAKSGGKVTTIDPPEVVASTLAAAELFGLGIKPEVIAGDYFEVEIEGPVDRIVMANVLHLETPEDAARLIRHHARALAPRGELVIVDMLGGDGLEPELSRAAYGLHLGMRTTKGCAHPEADLRAWCAEAGLTEHRVLPLGGAGLAALVARRVAPSVEERDTTEIAVEDLRALREANRTHEARFRMVFDGAADAIMVADKRAQSILQTNAAFRALFGVDWMESELRDLDEVVAPEDRTRLRTLLRGLADGSVTERRHNLRMLRDGRPFTAELAAFDPLARSVLCFIVRDRDRLLRTERLQALGELVGGLSHDLNTPLGVLKANCALAKRLAERLSSEEDTPRHLAALDQATRLALDALGQITSRLDAIRSFATLEGSALRALAPHFSSGLALAICQRAADP
jgi:PAS domain S-box-containing protein